MRPFGSLLPWPDAFRRAMDSAFPVERSEEIPLASACERILAEAVVAPHDVPAFDRAAVDGYALRGAEAAREGAALRCAGRILAGGAPVAVGPGGCVEIATGAPLPPGADAVVMVEETARSGDRVSLAKAVRPGQNVTRAGSDLARGEVALREGAVLGPAQVGAAAACGRSSLRVWARPRAAVFTTGDEVVEPGRPCAGGQVYNVNTFTLGALLESCGCEVARGGVVGDSFAALDAALGAHLDLDLLVVSGGTSVGEKDLLPDFLRTHGEVVFHGTAVKPGKPTLIGRIGRCLFVGVPGYPTSGLTIALRLVAPLARRIGRRPSPRAVVVRARLAREVRSPRDKTHFLPVRVADGVAESAMKESGAITSLAHADGMIVIPEGIDRLAAGAEVEVELL
ncbi:MAG: molybdopterin molybdotransferase MoeA [Planctomycetes bacterium]|nr:molybdopterin molybdotransferase MoeA [Planctomycetota bacterium]